MNFELKGKKAIVSAGGSGIGRSIVDEFINQGVSVSTCDIDAVLIKEIKIKYPEIHAEVVDVGDEKTVKEFCLKSIDALPLNKISIEVRVRVRPGRAASPRHSYRESATPQKTRRSLARSSSLQ